MVTVIGLCTDDKPRAVNACARVCRRDGHPLTRARSTCVWIPFTQQRSIVRGAQLASISTASSFVTRLM